MRSSRQNQRRPRQRPRRAEATQSVVPRPLNFTTDHPLSTPRQTVVNLRYVKGYTSALGSIVYGTFVGNGCYAVSGGTGQPTGFDQWMALYQHYAVIGARATATFVCDQTGSLAFDPTFCGVYISTDITGSADFETAITQFGGQFKPLTLSQPCVVTSTLDTKRFFRVKDVVGEPDFNGSVAANPVQPVYFQTWHQNQGGSTGITVGVVVVIEFRVVFSDPVRLTAS